MLSVIGRSGWPGWTRAPSSVPSDDVAHGGGDRLMETPAPRRSTWVFYVRTPRGAFAWQVRCVARALYDRCTLRARCTSHDRCYAALHGRADGDALRTPTRRSGDIGVPDW